jgi:hypothetical protein
MPSRRSIQNGPYGKGPNPFFKITKQWREAGQLDGMVTVRADGGAR